MIERGGVLLHIAVCDDERTMLNHLKQLVYDFFHKKRIVTVISLFSSGEELLQSGQEMDILFLDIQKGPCPYAGTSYGFHGKSRA